MLRAEVCLLVRLCVCVCVCVCVCAPALPGDGGAARAENDPKRREGPEAFDLKTKTKT